MRPRARSTASGSSRSWRGHGYRLSPGTLYPLLHGLERRGYLESERRRSGRSVRRVYRATPRGHEALGVARDKVRELFHEILGGP